MMPAEALQTTLAAEHAATHVLAALAGTARGVPEATTDDLPAQIAARHQVHRGRREQLIVLLRTADADPVPALPAYTLPDRDTVPDLRRGVLDVEQACLDTYTALVAASTDDARAWALTALLESAPAVLDWGAAPTPFPGAEDLLDP